MITSFFANDTKPPLISILETYEEEQRERHRHREHSKREQIQYQSQHDDFSIVSDITSDENTKAKQQQPPAKATPKASNGGIIDKVLFQPLDKVILQPIDKVLVQPTNTILDKVTPSVFKSNSSNKDAPPCKFVKF